MTDATDIAAIEQVRADNLFSPGDVVMAIHDIGPLRKGHLYRIGERVPGCFAYKLEGDDAPGFWASHLAKPVSPFTRSGPIRRLPSPA